MKFPERFEVALRLDGGTVGFFALDPQDVVGLVPQEVRSDTGSPHLEISGNFEDPGPGLLAARIQKRLHVHGFSRRGKDDRVRNLLSGVTEFRSLPPGDKAVVAADQGRDDH